MTCKKCGAPLAVGDLFCGNCGTPVKPKPLSEEDNFGNALSDAADEQSLWGAPASDDDRNVYSSSPAKDDWFNEMFAGAQSEPKSEPASAKQICSVN